MIKISIAVYLIIFLAFTSRAESLLESFGSGGNQFQVEFVTIGNPNNLPDSQGQPNPVGQVSYEYRISKFEVSQEIIEKANSEASLGISLYDLSGNGGNGLLKPATGISWFEAAKFVNWMNTSTGNQSAYKYDNSGGFQLWNSGDSGYQSNNPFRNSLAKYFLPSVDEWYKAAYGSPNGDWYKFPTESNNQPNAVSGGTSSGTAVFNLSADVGPADINSAGGLSAFGTMAQGGNVWEWMEGSYDGTNDNSGEGREMRGGSWYNGPGDTGGLLESTSRHNFSPSLEFFTVGFRVAALPEPSALSLLALGLGGLALVRRRRS